MHLPYDLAATALDVNHIADKLAKTGCENIVMFIDACREIIAGEKGAKSQNEPSGVKSVGFYSQEAVRRDGMVTFYSCGPQDRSYEIADLENSSFTYCLLQAIASGECSTVEEVNNYLVKSVPSINSKYHKPAQLPFTVLQPVEKAKLAIFYSRKRKDADIAKHRAVLTNVVSIYTDGRRGLKDDVFNEICELYSRYDNPNAASREDAQRFIYVEKFSCGDLRRIGFEQVWNELRRRGEPELPSNVPRSCLNECNWPV